MDGTILTVKQIDPGLPVPRHQQVAAVLRRAIIDEQCQPGTRLPAAVDLAAVLGVNRNTVLRALRALRDEGMLEFRRGRGVHVTGVEPGRTLVVDNAREVVALARRHGIDRHELLQLISDLW